MTGPGNGRDDDDPPIEAGHGLYDDPDAEADEFTDWLLADRPDTLRRAYRAHIAFDPNLGRQHDEADDDFLADDLWPATLLRLRETLTDRLHDGGHRRPWEAATSITVRGRLGLSVDECSKLTGIPERWLRRVEAGH